MWYTYYGRSERSRLDAWGSCLLCGYVIDDKEVLSVTMECDGGFRINIYNKRRRHEMGWREEVFDEVVQLKALVKAKELGWEINSVV